MTCDECWWCVRAFTDLYTWCINPKSEYHDQGVKKTFKCPLFIDRGLPIPDKEDEKYIRDHSVQIGVAKTNRMSEQDDKVIPKDEENDL